MSRANPYNQTVKPRLVQVLNSTYQLPYASGTMGISFSTGSAVVGSSGAGSAGISSGVSVGTGSTGMSSGTSVGTGSAGTSSGASVGAGSLDGQIKAVNGRHFHSHRHEVKHIPLRGDKSLHHSLRNNSGRPAITFQLARFFPCSSHSFLKRTLTQWLQL